MEKKVVVLGSTGMLGHVVYDVLNADSNYSVFNISYRKKLNSETIICDVSNLNELTNIIKKIQPDVIINCIGVLIKGAESSPANAIFINSYFPHFLVKVCNEIGSRLIHVSTDCVFSGSNGPYFEDSFRDSDDVYGRSKALGEVSGSEVLTVRTSIIGPELKEDAEGLFDWFYKRSESTIQGYGNVLWSGVTTVELARAIQFAIDNCLTGLWNLSNKTPISKLGLLHLFNEHLPVAKRKNILKNEEYTSSKCLLSKREDISFDVHSYSTMMNLLVSFINDRPKLYGNYADIE
jgi:dTDP-4-dehydrorhamnose reductase